MHPARAYDVADADALPVLWHEAWHRAHAGNVPQTMLAHRDLAYFQKTFPKFASQTRVLGPVAAPYGFLYRIGNYIDRLFIGARGKGYGRVLLRDAEDAMRAEGITEAELTCLVDNTAARAFYEACGWKSIAQQRVQLDMEIGGGFYDHCIYRKNI
jgi:putative acetyltransferase